MLARVVFVQISHATLVAWEFCKCLSKKKQKEAVCI